MTGPVPRQGSAGSKLKENGNAAENLTMNRFQGFRDKVRWRSLARRLRRVEVSWHLLIELVLLAALLCVASMFVSHPWQDELIGGFGIVAALLFVETMAVMRRAQQLKRRVSLSSSLKGVDLSRLDLSRLYLRGKDLDSARFTHSDLTRADLTNASLVDARLVDVDLAEAKLQGANCARASFFQSRLTAADLESIDAPNSSFAKADLHGALLSGAQLEAATFRHADLRDANLADATLRGADFTRADLSGARLDGADLTDVVFDEANLTGASVRTAQTCGVSYRAAQLGGADFWGSAPDPSALDEANAGGQDIHLVRPTEPTNEAPPPTIDLTLADHKLPASRRPGQQIPIAIVVVLLGFLAFLDDEPSSTAPAPEVLSFVEQRGVAIHLFSVGGETEARYSTDTDSGSVVVTKQRSVTFTGEDLGLVRLTMTPQSESASAHCSLRMDGVVVDERLGDPGEPITCAFDTGP